MMETKERSRLSLGYQQFNALCRKNATLKLRHWVQLLIEIAVPVIFMLCFDLIKNETTPRTVKGDVPGTSYPVASMAHLVAHTEYPNVLCNDNNIFYSCSCEEPENFDWYYSWWRDGWDTYGSSYWQNMHTDQFKICLELGELITQGDSVEDNLMVLIGVIDPVDLLDPDFICNFFQEIFDVCGSAQMEEYLSSTDFDFGDFSLSDLIQTCGLESSNDMESIHSSTLGFLDLVQKLGLGYTVSEDKIEDVCERQALAIAPSDDSEELQSVVANFEDFILENYPRLADFVEVFESEEDINQYVSQAGYSQDTAITPKIGSGVVFHSASPDWDYSVRLNFTKDSLDYREAIIPSTKTVTNPFLRTWKSSPGQERGVYFRPYADMYMTSSFLALQLLVDEFIFNQEATDEETELPNIRMANFPYKEFETSDFWESMAFLFAFMVVLAMMYPISNMIRAFVQEKELKLKEGMRMMGLSATAHTLSWWAHFVIFFFVLNVLMVLASRPLFEYSDPVIIFFYFMFFSLASISFSFLISAFFNRAKTAATIGVLFFFSSVFPYFAVNDSEADPTVKAITCLLPATCLALGTDAFVIFEDAAIGVTTYTVNQETNGSIAFSTVLAMLLVDTVLYSALAWYFNHVMPSTWGTHHKPYFIFTKGYWFPARAGLDSFAKNRNILVNKEESTGNANVQAVAEDLKRQIDTGDCIALRDLAKIYHGSHENQKIAVDKLNLTMYKGQITALLGHNGAGKTTTISMLTGMTPITSGLAFVQGKDVSTELHSIRRNLGVCPQHDILYPTMTVKEHLTMYASFKGVQRKEVSAEVEKMIKEVGLTEKRNAFSKNLSGGQRRKLSVAIAFIGNSKIVFLDEPTSGMDPYSRRFTWDVIRRNREGRIIVLTTHFMDEADLLGDRIAIMGDGKLRCCGTSLFLKSRFGVGYNLTCVKKMRRAQENAHFAKSPLSEEKQEISESSTIPKELGLSLCKEQELIDLVSSHVPLYKLLSNVGAEITFQLPQNTSQAFPNLLSEMDNALNDLGVETYGLSVTTLEEVFIQVAQGVFDEEVKEEIRRGSMSIDAAVMNELWKVDDAWKQERIKGFHLFLLHMKIMFFKRFLNYKRDRRSWIFTFISPAVFILVGMLILQYRPSWAKPSLMLDITTQYNGRVQEMKNPVLFGDECSFSDGNYCDGLSTEDIISQFEGVSPVFSPRFNIDPNETASYNLNTDLLESTDSFRASRYGAYIFEESSNSDTVFDATIHVNFTAAHAAPTFLNALNEALLRFVTGNEDASITIRNHPLKLTHYELSQKSGVDGFIVTIFVLFAFAFIPAGFAQYVVREKEMKIKYQQVVSGVNLNAYWLSSWLWDFLQFLCGPMALTLVLFAIFEVDILMKGQAGLVTFLLLLMFGLAVVPFTYLVSFVFKNAAVAQNMTILFNWVFGLLLMCATFIMQLIASTQDEAKVLRIFGRIFPQYCFADALLRISFRDFLPLFDSSIPLEPSPWEKEIAGYSLAWLCWEIFVYGALVLVVERWSAGSSPLMQKWDNLMLKTKKYEPSELQPDMIDEDVRLETERVTSGYATSDVIQINHLKKAFPTHYGVKEAVKDVTLGIPRGECFGLLGINGAGKSTTLSILTGEQPPTQGFGMLAGMNVTTQAEEVHKLVGYCPQFDAIFPSLTGRENLQIYGRIKGIPLDRLDGLVDQTIKQMTLESYADRISGGYSGGNKRKLSVAIAMIGGPELMFLDEPSTGMDPVARRYMWDVITKISTEWAQCAIILTTHSMEECEALCTRIGIMVGGWLRCLGSAQHLKSRFGMGFQLELGLELPSSDQVAELLGEMRKAGAATIQQLEGSKQDSEGVGREGLEVILNHIGCDSSIWLPKIEPQGSAPHLYHELHNVGSILLKDLASWVCLEKRSLEAESFIFSSFEAAVLRERQGTKMRFEYPPQKMSIGEMFAVLEEKREMLKIKEYSLSQTTLEQIFNFFAGQQEEETGDVAGIIKPLEKPTNPKTSSRRCIIPTEESKTRDEVQRLAADF